VSFGATHLYQHFAVAVDGDLVTIPQIDFAKYPDGIVGIPGRFVSVAVGAGVQARQLAAILRAGPSPLSMSPIGRVG
jgi:preprotein translocase subunit SecD